MYLSVPQGRANGMPAFASLIPSQPIWQISAYVRSMGGHGAKSARASRSDHMSMPAPAEATPKPNKNVQRDDS